jgi:parvulin-like peptidyl-prolyl isomerase
VVQDSVQAPEVAATRQVTAASTNPTTEPSTRGASSGQYITIGGVVAEVNGTPIYANKILKALGPTLAAEAKKLDEQRFHKTASDFIGKQVQEYISAELEFAAAERNLGAEDRTLADSLTTQWRQHKITEAGGSVEVARKRAQADGEEFEDLVHEQFRLFMTRIYYEKKVIPRIQVTADDMRRYYQLNQNKEFTDQDQVQFRLIKVDPRKSGGKEKAIDKIQDMRKRAEAGEDFASLAASNDDPTLMKSGGKVGGADGWIQKGAFALEKVENAVFKLQPGQVTDIVEENGNYYLAKLEQRKVGRVMPFEEEAVQDKIRSTLRKAQFQSLREQVQENLRKNAVIRVDNAMMNTAIDMAMQNYPSWAAA